MKKLDLYLTGAVLLVLVGFRAQAWCSAGGPGSIRGSVVDSISGAPLFGANVWVSYGEQLIGGATDPDGKFMIKPLNPGTYVLNCRYQGRLKKMAVTVNSDRITTVGAIAIGSKMLKGYEFVVYKDLIIADDPTRITELRSGFVKNPHLNNPMTMVTTLTNGVYQRDEGQPLYFRGARSDASAYYVDGIRITQFDNGFAIPSRSIGQLTIYTSGVPAKYGDLTGGVVAIETESYFSLLNQRRIAEQNASK